MSTNAFYNSVLIITGAASGIGRQVALQAAKLGSTVIATDIDLEGLQQTKDLGVQQGLQMQTYRLDVSDKEAIVQFADSIIPELKGRKLILVNNAGVALATGGFDKTRLDDFEWLLSINLLGVIRMTKAFYPYFLEQNKGHIVNLSSVFGLAGIANQSAYCTSKFGVRGFTETLRMELMGTNVHTTVVHPGGVKTNIASSAYQKETTLTEEMRAGGIAGFDKVAKTTPERAAALILDAVARKQVRLTIGADAKVMDYITRFFPVRYTSIFKKQMDKGVGTK